MTKWTKNVNEKCQCENKTKWPSTAYKMCVNE